MLSTRNAWVRYLGVLLALLSAMAFAAVLLRGGWGGLSGWVARPSATRTPAGLAAPVCALCAGAVLAWVGLSGLASVATRLPGRVGRHADVLAGHVAPSLVRTAVVAALGGSLALGSMPTTYPADRPDTVAVRIGGPATNHSVGRPLVTSLPAPVREPGAQRVVVHRGDSLWTIAAKHLGPGATPGAIARAWPHWYAANRDVIGDDPDQLRPGQLLVPPPHRGGGAA